jgi:acyl carrier protein phosphodiesterase
MNFLAHTYLAGDSDASIVGSLLGDFVKGRPAERYRGAIATAILHHRKVDSFTDGHPVARRSRRRFSSRRRRFAGIIVDVCYDHFLAVHWQRFSSENLDVFARRVYAAVDRHRGHLPDGLRRTAARMVAGDWLTGYRDLERVGLALDRIAGRLRRGERFQGALEEIAGCYAALENDFLVFFPQLIAFSQNRNPAKPFRRLPPAIAGPCRPVSPGCSRHGDVIKSLRPPPPASGSARFRSG